MAIQGEMYPDSSGFPMCRAQSCGGGGVAAMHDEMCSGFQRQQMLVANQMQQFQTQNTNPTNTQFFNDGLCQPKLKKLNPPATSVSQSSEIDQFIISQSERFRMIIREQMERHLSELIKRVEARTKFLLDQKDEEIRKEAIRTSQLESLFTKLQNESLKWQHIAKQNELHVISLSNTIAQLRDSAAIGEHQNNNFVEDTESCCDEQHSCFNGELKKNLCGICRTREVGVVFLPCRHLCSCTVCDTMTDFCPVCQTQKKISIEALFH